MAELKELITQLGQGQEAAFKAGKALEAIVAEATSPGKESLRGEVARQLAAELTAMTAATKDADGRDIPPAPVHSINVRIKLIGYLGRVAGPEQISALAGAMNDLDLREPARIALESIGSPEAAEALIAALTQVGPTFRVGVINALARIKAAGAVSWLRELAASDTEPQVRIAAVEALAGFADPASDAVVAKAAESECPRARARAWKARVRLAETLRLAGQKDAAVKIYKAVASGKVDAAQKKAAELALKS